MVVFDKLLLLLLLPSSMPGRPKWLWQCVPCTAEKTFQTNIHIPPSKPLCSSKLYFHSLLLAFSLLPCLVAREISTDNGGLDVFQAAHNTQQHTAKKGYAQRHQQRHAGETWPKRKGEEWRACSASSTELHPGRRNLHHSAQVPTESPIRNHLRFCCGTHQAALVHT